MISLYRCSDRMFPSIHVLASGKDVVANETRKQNATASFRPKKEISARLSVSVQQQGSSSPAPTLPRISREGSFTSLVSSRSSKSNSKAKQKKFKANKGQQEDISEKKLPGVSSPNSPSISTTELELDCEARNVDCGFPAHVQNPRFLVNGWAAAMRPQFPPLRNAQMVQMASSSGAASQKMRNTPRITYLGGKWQVRNAKDPKVRFVGVTEQATLNDRYKVPLIPTTANHRTKPVTTTHRRCSCHRHSGDLGLEETRKNQSIWERLAGTPQTSSDNLSMDARFGPTNRHQASRGLPATLRIRRKKAPSVASTSNSSLDKRKNKKSFTLTRSTSQINIKKPTQKVEAQVSTGESQEAPVDAASAECTHRAQAEERMEVDEVKSEQSRPSIVSPESETRLHEHLEIETIAGSVVSSSPHSIQRALTPRLLQVQPDRLKGSKDASELAKEFQRLDSDCDGHLSFKELTTSLPRDLSKKHTAYLKKIYDRACESTFFGLEEFMAVHQLCYYLGRASPVLSEAYGKLDFSGIESWLQIYMEVFSSYDRSQKGVISVESFQKLLVSANDGNGAGTPDIRDILNTMRKQPNESVTGVEVLAYIPYFVASFPGKTNQTT